MKKTLCIMAAAAMLGTAPVMAENINLDLGEYAPGSFIENTGAGGCYAHVLFQLPDNNSTDAAAPSEGERLFSTLGYTYTLTAPGFESKTFSGEMTPGFPEAICHPVVHLGVLPANTYTLTIAETLVYEDATRQPLVRSLSGNFTIAAAGPTLTLNGDVVAGEGTSARINYNAELQNYAGAANFTVDLFQGTDVTGVPAQSKNISADGFVIEGLTEGTEYSYTIRATVTGDGLALAPVTRTFTWTQTAPQPHAQFIYTLEPTAAGADVNYTITLRNCEDKTVENVLVAALKGGEAFNNEATYHYEGTAMEGTVPCAFDGQALPVWLKAMVTFTDGSTLNCNPFDVAVTLEKKATATFNPSVTIEPTGEFVRTGATSGTIGYKITVSGEGADQVASYNIKASRIGDEDMDVTTGVSAEGTMTLTVLPADAETQVWIKAQAVNAEGTATGWAQYGPVVCDTRTPDSFVYGMTAGNPQSTGSTTGTLDITITAENAEDVASYHVFVVRKPVEGTEEQGDQTVGEITIAAADITAYPYTFTLPLTNLLSNATTELWAKCQATMTDGTVKDIVTYPGEAQGWTGLSITTQSTGIAGIALDGDAVVDVYTAAGARVRTQVRLADALRSLPAGLYIAGGRKFIVK